MTTQPDETTPPPRVVKRIGPLLYVDGVQAWDDRISPLTAATARQYVAELRDGSSPALLWTALADFLDAAEDRSKHAVGAFPDDTPPPRRPRVQLRQQVDVNGLEVADLVVRVHPSTTDTAGALADAQRALHDAALAITRVLAVEPADRARTSS